MSKSTTTKKKPGSTKNPIRPDLRQLIQEVGIVKPPAQIEALIDTALRSSGDPAEWIRDYAAEQNGRQQPDPPADTAKSDEPRADPPGDTAKSDDPGPDPPADTAKSDEPRADQAKPEQLGPAEVAMVDVTVPLFPLRTAVYAPRHLDVQLDTVQSEATRRLFDGLDTGDGHRLNNGRRVASAADAVRWLLEEIDRCAEVTT